METETDFKAGQFSAECEEKLREVLREFRAYECQGPRMSPAELQTASEVLFEIYQAAKRCGWKPKDQHEKMN